jgi:hypothetical protein
MRFSDSRRPQKNHIAGFMNEAQGAKLANLAFVYRWLKGEVELIEGLHERQMRQLQAGAQIPASACVDFAAKQLIEEIGIARFLFCRLLKQTFQTRLHGFQAQRA